MSLFSAAALASILAAQEPDAATKGSLAEPMDAAEVRERIALLEKMLPTSADRGAVLYLLASSKEHLGETLEALKLLKECVERDEGFDPSGDPVFAGLRPSHDFQVLVDRVHQKFPVVAKARLALETEEKDLIPEGLAWDASRNVFYLGSLAQRKIVKISPDNQAGEFAPSAHETILPVLGIRLDPGDNSVWANSADETTGRSELLHLSGEGALLGRFALTDAGKHELNDLAIRKNGEIFITDSASNLVFRFEPSTHTFAPVHLHRETFAPNGITLGEDDNALYIADDLGIIRLDLATATSQDVAPAPRSTMAGADGLYWYKGSLIAIQNDIGTPRVAAFRLAKDGLRATQANILEYRSPFTILPTTGAIRDSDFYFISNSGLDNLNDGKIMDVTALQRTRIAMLHLP